MTMRRMTKKAMALVLHAEGATVEEIAQQLDTRPSYVANVLAAAGQRPAYHDLYVSTVVQSGYTPQERGLLRFKDVHAAQQSVHRLDTLYHACEHQHDRRGQHQAQLLALIGKNRAEGLGKYAEAHVFAAWLQRHLTVQRPALEGPAPVPADGHHASPDAPIPTCGARGTACEQEGLW
jgi:hypothetical protein